MVGALELFVLAFLPVIAVALIIILFVGRRIKGWARVKYAFLLHADKGLWQQGLFWFGILTPLAYFFTVGSVIWSGHDILISQEGFKNFIDMSGFPITLLSLAIPFAVIIASFNSSNQTAAQIRITREKNNIDLFNSHRKELFLYYDQVGEVNYFNILTVANVVHPRVHRNYFCGTPMEGTPILNYALFTQVESDFDSVKYFADAVIKNINSNMSFDFYVASLCPLISSLALRLGVKEVLKYIEVNGVLVDTGNKGKFRTVGKTTEEMVIVIRCLNDFFSNLCDFAGYVKNKSKER